MTMLVRKARLLQGAVASIVPERWWRPGPVRHASPRLTHRAPLALKLMVDLGT